MHFNLFVFIELKHLQMLKIISALCNGNGINYRYTCAYTLNSVRLIYAKVSRIKIILN